MGFWDSLSDFWFGPGRSAAQDVLRGTNAVAPQGPNSYEELLKSMATGAGPSLADQTYRRAADDQANAQVAMSRGRGPGAMRQASVQAGQIGQGMAAGAAEARTREQLGAAQLGAGVEQQRMALDQQRMMANQQAYMQALGMVSQQGGIGQSLAGLAGQGLGAYAMLRGPQRRQEAPAFNVGDLPDLMQWGVGLQPYGV